MNEYSLWVNSSLYNGELS